MKSCTAFDETIQAISSIANKELASTYVFYLYMTSQCRLVIDPELSSYAAINFQHDHYNLFINPDMFATLSIEQRAGVLKHEMLHILYNHVTRKEERHHKSFNVAADCALNQHINRSHLPEGAIYPDKISSRYQVEALDHKTTEYYYDIIPKSAKQDDGEEDNHLSPLDDHDKWGESAGIEAIAKTIAKNMLDHAMKETQKAIGSVPSECSDWLSILSSTSVVNWRTALRKVVGNKRVNKTPTIYKPNRRSPHLAHLKGQVKDRKFDLLVVADVSGSVSDEELASGLAEIRNLCKQTTTPVKCIQVDTEAYAPIEISQSLTRFNRLANGGTTLSPAIDKAHKCKVPFNAIVVITDGHITYDDIEAFDNTKLPVFWLLTTDIDTSPFEHNRMRAFPLCT